MTEAFKTPDRKGTAAGVPYIAFAPANPQPGTPLIVLLHLMDPPRSEHAMAAAIPLDGIDAWKVYFGLPMSGERAPEGGFDEIMRLAFEDGLMNLLAPVVEQAAAELPGAVTAVREQLSLAASPLILVGGSAGGAAVLLTLMQSDIEVVAAVLLNAAIQARPVVESFEEFTGTTYQWTDASRAKADSLDLVRRLPDLIARRRTPVLSVNGADDDIKGLPAAAKGLTESLSAAYGDPDLASFVLIEGLGHALAEEPGVEPAPQTEGAK
ncbi:MAG: alpha/beta hydrolase, partial [Dehalococcoidia bacterium]